MSNEYIKVSEIKLPEKKKLSEGESPWHERLWLEFNDDLDQCQKAIDEAKRYRVLDRDEIERLIDFWLRHLVAKTSDKNDYISKDKRIEGHRKSIADEIIKAMEGE